MPQHSRIDPEQGTNTDYPGPTPLQDQTDEASWYHDDVAPTTNDPLTQLPRAKEVQFNVSEPQSLSQDEATAFAASLSPSTLPFERELDTTSPAAGLWDCCLPQTKLCARALLKHAKELSRRNLPRPNGRQRSSLPPLAKKPPPITTKPSTRDTTCLPRTKICPRHTSAMTSTMMMVKYLVLHP